MNKIKFSIMKNSKFYNIFNRRKIIKDVLSIKRSFSTIDLNQDIKNISSYGFLLKNRTNSIYDDKRKKDEYSILNDSINISTTDPVSINEKEFYLDIQKIRSQLSEFLKSLEFARAFDIKHSKFIETRKSIPILIKDDVKKGLFEILANKQINNKSEDELENDVKNMLKISQSYETILDDTYYNNLVNFFQEIGKFILISNIYSVDHVLNVTNKEKNDILLKLADIKEILAFINYSDFKVEQLIIIFPVIIMLNNLYDISEIIMEKLINEIFIRIHSPLVKLKKEVDGLLASFLLFIIINNYVSNSKSYFRYFINYKEILLRNNDINDLLYIITDNIFKFVNSNQSYSDDYSGNSNPLHIAEFDEFLFSYLNSINLLHVNNIDAELFENFLYSLLLLHNFNNNLSNESKFISVNLISTIRNFFSNCVLEQKNIYPWLLEFVKKIKNLDLILEIENSYTDVTSMIPGNITMFLIPYFDLDNIDIDILKYLLLKFDKNNYKSESIAKLLRLLTPKIQNELINKKFSNEDFLITIDTLGKFGIKETKLLFELGYLNLFSDKKYLRINNDLSNLLVTVSKYNLINIYENFLPYTIMNLRVNKDNYEDLLKNDSDFNLIWALAFFSIKLNEISPILTLALNLLPVLIQEKIHLNTPIDSIENILQIISVAELLMQYGLTTEDYSKKFTPELISSLMTIYLSKLRPDPNYENLSNLFNLKFNHKRYLSTEFTNLDLIYKLEYRELILPLIIINDRDLNSDDKLNGKYFIKYYHVKSATKTLPIIINIDRIKTFEDFEEEFFKYQRKPKNVNNKYLI